MELRKLAAGLLIGGLMLAPHTAYGQTQEAVEVTLPSFPVTLNGVTIDSSTSQYPLIAYKGITYFPMTYHGARFLQLKANWYQNDRQKVLFIGYCAEKEDEWVDYPGSEPNPPKATAVIADYAIAVNTLKETEFIDNSQEEYPLLNFRGVTYFPLTWRFAVTEFGWDYAFSADKGLTINSTEQLRPELEDAEYLGATLPSRALGVKSYVYNAAKNAYAGYPYSNLAGASFVYQEKDAEAIYWPAEELCSDGEYYFNRQIAGNGHTEAEQKPVLQDGVLTVHCARLNNDGYTDVLLKIDLKNGTAEQVHVE